MKKAFYTLFSGLVLLAGCSKEGPVGPQGPAGPGVIGSDVVSVSDNQWTLDANTNEWYVTISDDNITSDIINNGVVVVYAVETVNNATTLVPLPYSNNTTYAYDFISVGSVEIDFNDGSSSTSPGNISFKIGIIAASVVAANPGVDFKHLSFKELQKYMTPTSATVKNTSNTATVSINK